MAVFNSLFSMVGATFLLRWLHYFFGVMWIGHLYYFNFTQGGFMAEADGATKTQVTAKLVPRALYWFRWGAMWTMVTGLIYMMTLAHQYGGFNSAWGVSIGIGAAMGLIMWANVWFVIWPNQKIVIASATAVSTGGAANPAAAASASKGLLASRTNTLFSIPMLFFMGAATHFQLPIGDTSNVKLAVILVALVIAGLEANGLKGKLGPMATVKGVITSGFALTGVLFLILSFTF
jgi:uncharacterized membrane protein